MLTQLRDLAREPAPVGTTHDHSLVLLQAQYVLLCQFPVHHGDAVIALADDEVAAVHHLSLPEQAGHTEAAHLHQVGVQVRLEAVVLVAQRHTLTQHGVHALEYAVHVLVERFAATHRLQLHRQGVELLPRVGLLNQLLVEDCLELGRQLLVGGDHEHVTCLQVTLEDAHLFLYL